MPARIIAFIVPLILLTIFSPGPRPASADLSAEEIATRLQTKYDAFTTLTASFEQKTDLSVGKGRSRYGSGRLAISKPGQMRWDYDAPDRQVLVCDGKSLSIYTEKNSQMITGPAQRYLESDVTFAFFTGQGRILNDFTVAPPTEGAMTTEKGYRIKLTPQKPHPHVEELTVEADATSLLVTQLTIRDKFGSITSFSFFDHRLNGDLPKLLFSFTPPSGTEIIEQP